MVLILIFPVFITLTTLSYASSPAEWHDSTVAAIKADLHNAITREAAYYGCYGDSIYRAIYEVSYGERDSATFCTIDECNKFVYEHIKKSSDFYFLYINAIKVPGR